MGRKKGKPLPKGDDPKRYVETIRDYCPECHSFNLICEGTRREEDTIWRYKLCRDCGARHIEVQEPKISS